MNVKELLKKCQRDRTAVLATNFYNFGIPLLVPYTKDFERITQF